jgi:prephenate dehydrogenase
LQPIGGHPMCGRETSGIESADASLFKDAFFMLTPLPRTNEKTIAKAEYFVNLLGARPYIVDADRHDRIAAAASPLPFSVASVLMATAIKTGTEDDLLWDAVSSGFRDTSRLAACDVTMMLDILMSNRKAICQEINTFDNYLRDFRIAVERQDEIWLKDFLTKAKQKRNELFVK